MNNDQWYNDQLHNMVPVLEANRRMAGLPAFTILYE